MGESRPDYVLDLEQTRRGYALSRMCASLSNDECRQRFSADESAYCDEHRLSREQKNAVLARDWVTMLELGASIFHIFKLAQVDKRSMQYLGGVFTGMTTEEFSSALRSGGRKFG